MIKRLLLIVGLCFLIFAGRTALAYDALCASPITDNSGNVTGYVSGWDSSGHCTAQGSPCYNASNTPICKQDAAQQTGQANQDPIAGPTGVLQTVTNIMALLTGIVAVVMIIIAGFQFITAGGSIGGQRAGDNPSKAKKARANLTSAVIGLIIVALSWSIITFVVQKFVQ